jgi:hypothetical protein
LVGSVACTATIVPPYLGLSVAAGCTCGFSELVDPVVGFAALVGGGLLFSDPLVPDEVGAVDGVLVADEQETKSTRTERRHATNAKLSLFFMSFSSYFILAPRFVGRRLRPSM